MGIKELESLGINTGLYRIEVNGHVYASDRVYVDNCIKAGKSAMKGKNAIIAIEKDKVVMLMNEAHESKEEMNKAVAEYVKEGFKVYTA